MDRSGNWGKSKNWRREGRTEKSREWRMEPATDVKNVGEVDLEGSEEEKFR